MIADNETFNGTFPFTPHFSTAAGFRMHYVDEGSGDPIICLHGEPTWGYIYRNFIPRLAVNHRVIVPDHMGFGKSETPADREYSLQAHTENLVALVEELDLSNITFVAQDWGGPIAAAFTVRHPERVRRLCLMNSILGYANATAESERAHLVKPPKITNSPWFTYVKNGLSDGTYQETMSHLGDHVVSIMARLGLKDPDTKPETWNRAYSAHFVTPADCKAAIEFPLDVALGRIAPYVREGYPGVAALRSKPAMLVEGLGDLAIPPELAIYDFKALFPNGPVIPLPGVGHFCQEDVPDTLVALIELFLQLS